MEWSIVMILIGLVLIKLDTLIKSVNNLTHALQQQQGTTGTNRVSGVTGLDCDKGKAP